MKKLISSLLISIFIFTLCISVIAEEKNLNNTEIIVAAAADLTGAFTEIGNIFEKQNKCKVIFTFGSTGTLSEQIENGAPFDIFAAANVSAIEKLDKNGKIISDTVQIYAIGRIGIVTKKVAKFKIKEFHDLLKPEIKKIAIANPDHAPYGLAAKQSMESAKILEQLKDKMVYGKNIQEALTYITTGNADAGIIALSLYDKNEVNLLLIDDKMHKPLKQVMAVVKGAKHEALARQFIKYVNSREGREIMKKYGFSFQEETK